MIHRKGPRGSGAFSWCELGRWAPPAERGKLMSRAPEPTSAGSDSPVLVGVVRSGHRFQRVRDPSQGLGHAVSNGGTGGFGPSSGPLLGGPNPSSLPEQIALAFLCDVVRAGWVHRPPSFRGLGSIVVELTVRKISNHLTPVNFCGRNRRVNFACKAFEHPSNEGKTVLYA